MRKGEASRQRLICCAAECFRRDGYAATGVSSILKDAGLPKGSFYFYFRSKDELAAAVVAHHQSELLEKLRALSADRSWEAFVDAVFDFLQERTAAQLFSGCPFAIMGMETAFQKPELAKENLEMLKQLQAIFGVVLLRSGLPQADAELLAERMLAVYQGSLLLGRIGCDSGCLERARRSMHGIYREYRAFHAV